MKACVDRLELENFLRGKIPEHRAEEIAVHVDDCETCQDTVVDLAGAEDTFVAGLKQQDDSPQQSIEKENAFKHGLQRLLAGVQRSTPNDEQGALPERIGPYILQEPLGSGGMGHVYKAQHSKLKRTVALKVLPAHRWSNAAAISRFEREMQAIGGLDHPHIVRASDAGEDEGMHYLVMEHVDGLDLGRLSKRLGQLPVAEACELARQAAIGLQHAHDNGLVHRDVKPSNLMLAREQSTYLDSATTRVKILDLGLALLGDEHLQEDHDMTTVGALMGTLDYMSPEQGIDSHSVDHRADIYGLGATLFKLLTGRAPYADPQYSTLMKKMTALATKSAPSVGAIRPDLPESVIEIVDRMLARDPDERFASAREVAEALTAPADGADLSELVERGLSTAEPAQHPKRTRTAVRTAPTPATSRPEPNGSGKRLNRWPLALAAGFFALIAAGGIWIATDYGTIKIDSLEPDTAVVVKRGDEVFKRMVVTHGRSLTRIRSGEYQIEVPGRPDIVIEPSFVSVARNHDSRVRIGKIRVDQQVPVVAQPRGRNQAMTKVLDATHMVEMTDNGKTFEDNPRGQIEITGNPAIRAGDREEFQLSVRNTGSTELTNGTLHLFADENIVFLAAGGNWMKKPGALRWDLEALPPGHETTVEVALASVMKSRKGTLKARASWAEGFCTKELQLKFLPVSDKLESDESSLVLSEPKSVTSPSNQLARYNGRTLREWLEDVKYERNRNRVDDAVNAVAAMFDDAAPEAVDESVETLFALMRRYGQEPYAFNNDGNYVLCDKAFQTLVKLPPDVLVHRILREFYDGNDKSHAFLSYFLYPSGELSQGDLERLKGLHAELKRRRNDVLNIATHTAGEWPVKFTFQFVNLNEIDLTTGFNVEPLCLRALKIAKDPMSKVMAAWMLARTNRQAKELPPVLRELLATKDAGQQELTLKLLAMQSIEQLGASASEFAPDVTDLLQSNLVRYNDDGGSFRPWVPGFKPYGSGGMGGIMKGAEESRRVFLPTVLSSLEKFGPEAKGAVPYLLELYFEQPSVHDGIGGSGSGGGGGGGGPDAADELRSALTKIAPELSEHVFTVEGVGDLPSVPFNSFGEPLPGERIKQSAPLLVNGYRFDPDNEDVDLNGLRRFAALSLLAGEAAKSTGQHMSLDWAKQPKSFGSELSLTSADESVTIVIQLQIRNKAAVLVACQKRIALELKKWNKKDRLTIDVRKVAEEARRKEVERQKNANNFGGMF